MPLQKFANVSDNRSLTVAALIGAPTVREGLHQDTRPYLRNGVLSSQLPVIGEAPLGGFQAGIAAAFLLDQVEFHAAGLLGRVEDGLPRDRAFAEQHAVS